MFYMPFKETFEGIVDEIIAIMVVAMFGVTWYIGNPIPQEFVLMIFAYYFGRKATKENDKVWIESEKPQ